MKHQRRCIFMTIKEVEERTGLSRSNIRFYEKENLIAPQRNEKNGYREYSQEDVEQIEKIAYLRTLNITVEDIRKIITEEASLYNAIKKQTTALDHEIADLQKARLLCQEMLKHKELNFANLSVQDYVNNLPAYWEANQNVFRLDTVSLIYTWGGLAVWAGITVLCLLIAIFSFSWLPEKIPVQWSRGTVTSSVDKLFIFAYPAVCILIRFPLRPFIWRALYLKGMPSDAIANYISNFLCFVALSAQVFTILYLAGILKHITVILFLDAVVFLGLLVWGWNRVYMRGDQA